MESPPERLYFNVQLATGRTTLGVVIAGSEGWG
jgi:hypothetical protein